MISDLFALALICLFFFFGLRRPNIALCGVIWVDNFRPQELSLAFLQGQPLSALMTIFFLLTLVVNFKKIAIPRSSTYHFNILFFMFWITLTTAIGQYPEIAWFKHDSAFKTILAAYFIPFVIQKREHVESFLWISVVTFGTLSFFAGVKTLLGGGGYNVNLIGQFGGSFWSEGSTLATMCVALVPICLAILNTNLVQSIKIMRYATLGYAFASFLAVIGTQARAGLVCIAAYGMLLLKDSQSKIKAIFVVVALLVAVAPFVPESWYQRMSTISSSENASADTSAMGRVVVWRWTFDYVADRPIFGGGFYAYRANAGVLSQYSKGTEVGIETPHPKAWHNIFIEVLGTQGYVGLSVFLAIIFHALVTNRQTARLAKNKKGSWQAKFAKALNISLMVYCTGGLFVNIAFYPWIYYVYGLSIGLFHITKNEYKPIKHL